jgi:hypothetical protein
MNGFNDEFFEMREYVMNELNNLGLQDLHDNLKNAILTEFFAKLEDYNLANETNLTQQDAQYNKLLLETVKFVLEKNKDVDYQQFKEWDVVEDDYSEQSDAEMHM